MTEATRDTVVRYLGGVLIDWNPRHLYRKLFDDRRPWSLATVCTHEWNRGQDAGRTLPRAPAGFEGIPKGCETTSTPIARALTR
jgi:hypothetical protein